MFDIGQIMGQAKEAQERQVKNHEELKELLQEIRDGIRELVEAMKGE